jgi:surface antigen
MRRLQGLLVCVVALAMMALVAFAPPRAAAVTADHAVAVGTRACKHRHAGRGPKETAARRRCMRRVRESARRHIGDDRTETGDGTTETGDERAEAGDGRTETPGPRQSTAPTTVGPVEAAALAHERWMKEGAAILGDFNGSGQCTEWAAQKRPDVIQRVFEADWAAQLQGVAEPAHLGDADTWATAAAAVGFQVSELPVAGALVVWQPNVEGAGEETGHVGYVESVSPDGSTFSTSEENFGGVFLMGYRTLSTTPVAGRSFILP